MIGEVIKPGDTVIYESTVYPGTTEDECIPVIEQVSGLTFNEDFFAGYSPERINPGDKEHRVANILKVTSGSTPVVANFVDNLYRTIIKAGTFKASSIKVAEASKVIENTQRDVNIGLINELAHIFDHMQIDTEEVLKAAGTKWNFLPFRPGLVGGHCISVDPYYLTHKAQALGYYPEMIMASRKINDGMGFYIAQRTVKEMVKKGINPAGGNALIMGFTFKENCPDLRNTRVVDIIDELQEYGMAVDVYDPWADAGEAADEYDVALTSSPENNAYDAIIIAVAHGEFKAMSAQRIHAFGKDKHVIFDVKYVLPADEVDARL